MNSVLTLDKIRSLAFAMREKIKALKVSYQYTLTPAKAEKGMRPAYIPARNHCGTFAMKGKLQSSQLEGIENGKSINKYYVIDGTHVAYRTEAGDTSSSVARIDRLGEVARKQLHPPRTILLDDGFKILEQ